MLPSCVPIGDASDPVTEEVVSVGTLQELVDRVRADKSKKKVFTPTNCLHTSLPLDHFNQQPRTLPSRLLKLFSKKKNFDSYQETKRND